MIKFEKYYDGKQTHIQAISTKETKNNGNIDCCYTIGKYIKEEIEELQDQLQQKENIIKEVKDYIRNNMIMYDNIEAEVEDLLILLDKGE